MIWPRWKTKLDVYLTIINSLLALIMKPMKLSKLIYHLYDTSLYEDRDITGLALDSRNVKPGNLFFACKGSHLDGREFIDDAINKGASVVLTDFDSKFTSIHLKKNALILPVDHLNQRIGEIAATFYDHPSVKFPVIGITGTNGKTSCSFFIAQALTHIHRTCGVIGTLGNGIYPNISPGNLTTPDAISVQSILADFASAKVQGVAMEVSSHSLDQGRVKGVEFEVGVFTNLTRDHLDYHGTMEEYGAAKKKLFATQNSKHAVINADDEFGSKMLASLQRENIYAYSLNKTSQGVFNKNNLIYADDIIQDSTGMHANIWTPWGHGKLQTPILGHFNLSNILAVLTSLCLLKIPFEQAYQALNYLSPVPGRMQKIGGNQKPLIVVDYAHSPDALEKVLIALRAHCGGKLYCLFGCGGDRDRGKRPLMAKIAESYSDKVVVTDDNPRTEDPGQIMSDIMQGFKQPKEIIVQHDRSKAIQSIIQYAKPGDCVLIAGKGAEMYQLIGNEKIPFSDVDKVLENLS